MNRRDLPVRLLAAACAVGLTVCGLFLKQEEPPDVGEENVVPPVVEKQDREEATSVKQRYLKLICPKLSTAADAFLLMTGESAVLIDTGEELSADTILMLMEENGVKRLNALILTHFDKDHIGGAAEILLRVPVDTLYRPAQDGDSPQYAALAAALKKNSAKVVKLTKTDVLTLDGVTYTLYPPLEKKYKKNQQNNSSIITSVTTEDGHSLLFMGDAEKARVKEFIDRQYDGIAYEFLKIPHHGRDPKPLSKILDAFEPKFALVTSSKQEPEDSKLLKSLSDEGVETYLTREGTVTILCDENRMSIDQNEE